MHLNLSLSAGHSEQSNKLAFKIIRGYYMAKALLNSILHEQTLAK